MLINGHRSHYVGLRHQLQLLQYLFNCNVDRQYGLWSRDSLNNDTRTYQLQQANVFYAVVSGGIIVYQALDPEPGWLTSSTLCLKGLVMPFCKYMSHGFDPGPSQVLPAVIRLLAGVYWRVMQIMPP